jgi:sec-independent protein translocase protein TatA
MSDPRPGDGPEVEGVMGSFSLWHWLVVLLVVLLLFGSGKVSNLMGDFAKGIKSFKKNMADDSDASMEAAAEKPAGSISPPGPHTTANQTTAARQG